MVDSFPCLRRTVTADEKVKEDRRKESHQESKCCVFRALSCMEEQESIKYTKIRIFNTNVRLVFLNASETYLEDGPPKHITASGARGPTQYQSK